MNVAPLPGAVSFPRWFQDDSLRVFIPQRPQREVTARRKIELMLFAWQKKLTIQRTKEETKEKTS